MRSGWSPEEDRIVEAAAGPKAAVAALEKAGFDRTISATAYRREKLRREGVRIRYELPSALSSGADAWAWTLKPKWPAGTARRIAAFIESNSPMTLAEYEAGMRSILDGGERG